MSLIDTAPSQDDLQVRRNCN